MSKKVKIIISFIFLALIAISGMLLYSSQYLTISTYDIKTEKFNGSFKIALISDLHNKEFGKDNVNLINKISQQKPDIITVVGDLVTDSNKNRSTATTLLSKLKNIAPTYCCLGNHEKNYYDYDALIHDIKNSGAVLLDNEMTNLKINDENLTIGGLSDFPYYEFDAPDYNNEEAKFMDKFIKQEKDNFSVLLEHQPEFYIWGLKDKDIDLMLCGHTHGGIIRLPFIGGLIAPNQGILANDGLLPKYDKGMFSSGTATMIITSGLGNEVPIPRFNNPPEICIINVN